MAEKIAMTISVEVDGKAVKLQLRDSEVLTGISVCDKAGLKDVICMKKGRGAALWFTNSQNAANAQQRHGYDYSFTVSKAELLKNKPEEKTEEKKEGGGFSDEGGGSGSENAFKKVFSKKS